jgi:uroporphyrinogen-III synthase
MGGLHGVGVLVTRPADQALSLCRLLEDEGATTLRFPTIEIKQLPDLAQTAQRIGAIDAFDLIIFTSANAVRLGTVLLAHKHPVPLAAIGPATARALSEAGYSVAVQPHAGFDSESLLTHARLNQPAGCRILLVKGRGGRELLQQELTRRGADVVVAEVYERVALAPSERSFAQLQNSFHAQAIQVVTATSIEIATRLLALGETANLRRELAAAHWLLPGERIAAQLRAQGFAAPLLKADSADDQDLLAALLLWRATESGA